tara:strand:+ start:15316 stop:15963 length:648 start_codon:yes stop_codon:yes gene_type:complete
VNNYIIDFDSTFIKIESLDELLEVSEPGNKPKIDKVKNITNEGMEGKISFSESLSRRIKLLEATKDNIDKTVKKLRDKVSDSFVNNTDFLKKNKDNIYIVSSGFHEIIDPIVLEYGILKKNIFANNFIFDKSEKIIGYDEKNPLSTSKGKVKILKMLGLKGTTHIIGDGFTDFEIKKEGYADYFYLFTENINRKSLIKNADFLLKSFDQFIQIVK